METEYTILPAPIEKVIKTAQRLRKFLAPQVSITYLSEHIREPLDGEAIDQPELPFSE